MKQDGYSVTDIEFLHLIYGNNQCFTAANYPDMIIAAQQIEIYLNPEQGKSIKNYKANIAGARINRSTVKQLLHARDNAGSIIMTKEEEDKLLALGINVKELRETAKRVLSAIARRKRIEPVSDEDDEL